MYSNNRVIFLHEIPQLGDLVAWQSPLLKKTTNLKPIVILPHFSVLFILGKCS